MDGEIDEILILEQVVSWLQKRWWKLATAEYNKNDVIAPARNTEGGGFRTKCTSA
jgi:hypothetical protein